MGRQAVSQAENLNDKYAITDKDACRFGQAIVALPLFGIFPLFVLVQIACARTWFLIYGHDVFLLTFCGMLWVSYPGCAFVSAAMSACPLANVIAEQEVRPALQSAQMIYKKYASRLLIAGTASSIGLLLGSGFHTLTLAWHNLQAGHSWFGPLRIPLTLFAAAIVGLLLLNAACQAGAHWGEYAWRERNSRSGQFLNRCWLWCAKTWRKTY
jgi:hypothetical protein